MDNQKSSLAELGKKSLYFLGRGILGKDYMTPQVHKPVCAFLQDEAIKRKILVLPRSFLKSTLGVIVLSLWLGIQNPDIRILIVCNIIENAMNHLRQIKAIIETNDMFRALYPDVIPDPRKVRWSDQHVDLKRPTQWGESTFNAAGLGGNIVSTHYDYIIMDDILTGKKDSVTKEELMPSQLEIERAIGWYKLSISLLDTPSRGRMLYLGTPWALHDVVDYIINEDQTFKLYTQSVYKGGGYKVHSKEQVPIYPERFDAEALALTKKQQGSYIYASQYLLEPLPAEKMVFKSEDIQYFAHLPNVPYWVFTYVDPAISSKKTACNTAIITIARTCDNRIYVIDCIRERGLRPSKLLDMIFAVHKKYKPMHVGIESVAYQESIGMNLQDKMLADNYFFSIKGDTPSGVDTKDVRIRGMQPRFQAKGVWIKKWMDGLESELLEYQGVDKSPYVDAIDALAGAIKISMEPPEKEVVVETGWTMAKVLEELRDKHGYNLPFEHQLSAIGAPKDRSIN